MSAFKIHSEYQPTGDQPQAIAALTEGVEKGFKHQVLLGVTAGTLKNEMPSAPSKIISE